ncbi:hypothetical protein JCM24511_07622 [Saitozyma sp. JCM 24511]|nr:hypothetical protein JCM24511_07622 [Saitozyma sp. JCM 24511]
MSRPSSTSGHTQVTPTVPPAVHALASPPPLLIDAQLPGYLLPSVLSLLRDSAAHVVRQKRLAEDALRAEGLLPSTGTGTDINGNGKGKGRAPEDDEADLIEGEMIKRVERIGLMVGGYIAEKLTLARPPLASHLDIIKFICKDLFLYVYSKQIDNLRTNHRGVFVLQSHAFPPLVPLSSYRGSAADMEAAKAHLVFPQALVQGALARLGMPASVTAETSGLPQCTFQIRTVKASNAPTSATNTPAAPSSGTPVPSAASGLAASASTGLGIAGT